MEFKDVIFTVIYGLMTILSVFALVRFSKFSSEDRSRMQIGILLKIFGSIAFMLIYTFYYQYGGDAYAYFQDAVWHNKLLLDSPVEFFRYAFGATELNDLWSSVAAEPVNFQKGTKEFFVTVLFSFFSFMGLGNYFATTIIFAFCSFFGHWLLYKVLKNKFPDFSFWAFVCVFCLPSGIIWGSGLVKENIVLALMGVFFYFIIRLVERKKYDLKGVFFLLLTIFFIAKVKLYVVLSLMPALAVWISLKLFSTSSDIVVRRIFKPVIILSSLVVVIVSIQVASRSIEELSLDSFVGKARAFQDWHYKEGQNVQEQHGRGSSYTLGSYESTWLGTLGMVPASINVTFFRPYPWEVSSPIVAFVSIESMIVLLLVLYIFTRKVVYRYPRIVFGEPFFFFMLIYALILGFLVGFTSYNFGALDRYKIPAMPFFIFSMMILWHKIRTVKSLE